MEMIAEHLVLEKTIVWYEDGRGRIRTTPNTTRSPPAYDLKGAFFLRMYSVYLHVFFLAQGKTRKHPSAAQ